MEDNQIVDLYWCRDEDAIQETGRKYTQFCFGIAWNILFNKEDSEECVNDTWLAAWKYIPPQKTCVFFSILRENNQRICKCTCSRAAFLYIHFGDDIYIPMNQSRVK